MTNGEETGAGASTGQRERFGGLRTLARVFTFLAVAGAAALGVAGFLFLSVPTDPYMWTALGCWGWAVGIGIGFGLAGAISRWMVAVGEAILDLEGHQRRIREVVDEQYRQAGR